jgi:DNA-binding PadR family transcriptional regulator
MFSNFGDSVRVLTTLKKWGILSEKQVSELSKLSHRRSIQTLRRLEQDRLVKVVESRRSEKTYRITGSGLDHLDKMKQEGRSAEQSDRSWRSWKSQY